MIKHGKIVKTVRDILMRGLRMSFGFARKFSIIFFYYKFHTNCLLVNGHRNSPFFISCSQLMEAGVSGPAGRHAPRRVVLSGSLATGAVLVLCQWQEGQRVQASKSSTRAWECR